MDFYVDVGAAVLLRILKSGKESSKYRKLFLKIFKAIGEQFRNDPEFEVAAKSVRHDTTLS